MSNAENRGLRKEAEDGEDEKGQGEAKGEKEVTKRKRVENRRNPDLENSLVALMHDGLSFSQACRACKVPRKTVVYWRDKDADLDERLRNAQTLGVSRLNDDVLERYQAVIDGDNSWTKEQVSAMRDYSQHVRWLSSKLYPKQFGEKGIDQVSKQGDGSVTLTWMTNAGGAEEKAVELADPLLIEGKAEEAAA